MTYTNESSEYQERISCQRFMKVWFLVLLAGMGAVLLLNVGAVLVHLPLLLYQLDFTMKRLRYAGYPERWGLAGVLAAVLVGCFWWYYISDYQHDVEANPGRYKEGSSVAIGMAVMLGAAMITVPAAAQFTFLVLGLLPDKQEAQGDGDCDSE